MSNKLFIGLKSLGVIILAILLLYIFGLNSFTKFVFKKVLFTPYNIVGIIMTLVTICGGYINRKEGHWIKLALTILSGVVSLFSFACTIFSWFNINLLNLIWIRVLKPAAVSVGTVLLWILIVIGGIALVSFAIYGIFKLILYKKEEKTNYEVNQINSEKLEQFFSENANSNNVSHSKPRMLEESNEKNPKQNVFLDNYEMSIANNKCPVCGWFLKRRTNRETGERFRGCSNYGYHNCTFTISEDEYMRIYRKYHKKM